LLSHSAVAEETAATFRHAAETGDLQTLRELRSATVIDARDASGRTALILATLYGQSAAVEALLAYGADPNAADEQGITPLQAAESTHQSEIVAALRRHGAH
jgi:ankyrin repeat protein